MKKLLFTLLSAVALFNSCNNDNEILIDSEIDNNLNEKKYTVSFNIASDGFEVDKTPIRNADFGKYSFLQIIVYKESGEVYSDSIIDTKTLDSLIAENEIPNVSIQLPEGEYYLSVFSRSMTSSAKDKIENFKIIPVNYETDYYVRELNDFSGNENIYYYTNTLKVSPNTTNENNIVLDPMWSYITSFDIVVPSEFIYPSGSDIYIYQISPRYYGFGIKSKLAKTPYLGLLEEFQHYDNMFGYYPNKLPISISKSEDKSLYLDVCFIKSNDGYSGGRVLKIQQIDLNTQIENGMKYTISGTLPAIDNMDTHSMHISLEPLKDSNIDFE